MTPRIAVVTGPTASGKTALSIALAKALGGEVVSADSMQVYRGMDIGTAKPTMEEMDGVPHHMIDVLEPGESYSVARYADEASACVRDILARGHLPIVCGGTGLYIDALVRGSGFQPGGDPQLRAQLAEEWEMRGAGHMMARLEAADPESAHKLHVNDRKRILRALEVYLLTGQTLSAHNARTRDMPPRYKAATLALTTQPRDVLYARIDARVQDMLARGLADEVRALWESGRLTGTAAQAIGYKELAQCFEGQWGMEEAVQHIAQRSRNYAKRQLSWLRSHSDLRGRDGIRWMTWNTPAQKDTVVLEATNFLMHPS